MDKGQRERNRKEEGKAPTCAEKCICRVRDGSGEDQSGRWISEVGRKPTALHIPDTVAG